MPSNYYEKKIMQFWKMHFLDPDYKLVEDLTLDISDILLPYAENNERNVALDVGCGNGRLTPILEQLYKRVISFDISDSAITLGKKVLPRSNFLLADSSFIPVSDRSVDGAFCWRVLHNLTQQQRQMTLLEIKRVLRRHGIAIFVIANINDPIIKLWNERGKILDDDPGTFVVDKEDYFRFKRFYSQEDVSREIGPWFKISTIETIYGIPGRKPKQDNNERNVYWLVVCMA